MRSRVVTSLAAFAFVTVCLIGAGEAQPYGPDRGWGGGMMMGPGMMGGFGFGRICTSDAAGFAEWRIARLERALKPTEAQREAFNNFKKASATASQAVSGSCPVTFPSTATARLEAMEKRMEAMLQAVKTIRPAFDALYATLSDEQKVILDDNGYRRRIWRRDR